MGKQEVTAVYIKIWKEIPYSLNYLKWSHKSLQFVSVILYLYKKNIRSFYLSLFDISNDCSKNTNKRTQSSCLIYDLQLCYVIYIIFKREIFQI